MSKKTTQKQYKKRTHWESSTMNRDECTTDTPRMKTKVTHLILSAVFAVIFAYMASIVTIMFIPILWYILTAIAKMMDNNFDITIRTLCWVYTVLISYYLWIKTR